MNEADTCREYVLPKLQQAGWDQSPHSFSEQQPITDGRIVTIGTRTKRLLSKRPDYLLRYASHHTLAVVEAKREGRTPGAGLQQAKEYAEMLKLNFAYATNGHGIETQRYRLKFFRHPIYHTVRIQHSSSHHSE